MNFPNHLQKGDSIAIIACARKISLEELNPTVLELKSWGLNVVFSPNLFEVENQFAGTDKSRAEDLQWAINEPNLKAVIVARGGYGTSRIIDSVDFSMLEKYPKWFIGFSDITVLLSHLFLNNFASIHGPVALLLAKEGQEENARLLKSLLLKGKYPTITSEPHKLNKFGIASGQIIGGNLSILHSIIATDSDLDYNDKILFIEDLDEYFYHIDRIMVHLERTGKFKKLAGLIVGHMSDMKDNTIPFGYDAYEIIHQHTSNYFFPISFGMPVGHQNTNFPIVVGAQYSMKVDAKGGVLEHSLEA